MNEADEIVKLIERAQIAARADKHAVALELIKQARALAAQMEKRNA